MCGLSRSAVAAALRDLPLQVRMVCARRKFSADDKTSLSSSASTLQRLVKAKSEQSLASTSESASLSRNKSRSLERVSKLGMWSCEPTEVQLLKGDAGLGFSILDDPVCMSVCLCDFLCCFICAKSQPHYRTSSVIIIIIIPGQCLWCCHHAGAALREFTLVHAVSAARRQVAADLWTKPIGLNHKPACRLPVNYTHHRHFIITQPES